MPAPTHVSQPHASGRRPRLRFRLVLRVPRQRRPHVLRGLRRPPRRHAQSRVALRPRRTDLARPARRLLGGAVRLSRRGSGTIRPSSRSPGEGSMGRLDRKVALITGAQQGIGRGMAIAFARDGADVGINYLDDRTAAEGVAEEVRKAGARAVLVEGDVARVAQAEAMVGHVTGALGGLDILVNNAGVDPRVPFLEMREDDWDLVLDVNLKGSFFCAQAAAKAMVAGRRRGAILNVASQAIRGAVRGVHYSASKGGVVAMTRAMALELAPHHIRVNAIAPGLTNPAH